MRIERIGDAVLYLGDCLDVLPTLPKVNAVITDPPYGQKQNVNVVFKGGSRHRLVPQRGGSKCLLRPNVYLPIAGDNFLFDPRPWLDVADIIVFWGAHKFADRLPPGGWLVWDKVPTGKRRDQGDGEAAWINRDQPMRIFRLLWDGLCVGEGARHEVTAGQQRVHPTQKPEVLMEWTLAESRASGIVLDPYMGAGSTGVAAARRGLPFIGIEIESRYFDTACERIENAQRQMRLLA